MTKQFSIIVTDVNEPPVSLNFLSTTSSQVSFPTDFPHIRESAVVGQVLGQIKAVDPDTKDSLQLTLDDNAGGLFSISQATCTSVSDAVMQTVKWRNKSKSFDQVIICAMTSCSTAEQPS